MSTVREGKMRALGRKNGNPGCVPEWGVTLDMTPQFPLWDAGMLVACMNLLLPHMGRELWELLMYAKCLEPAPQVCHVHVFALTVWKVIFP